MLVEKVSPAADQPEPRAGGQPLVNLEGPNPMIVSARSGYRPQCFRSAALVGRYSNVTLPDLRVS
eukprot:1160479-Pelagomonas_calceolata.AAC.16